MKPPTALDFAKLYDGVRAYGILPSDKVASILRDMAYLLERSQAPMIRLKEAYSSQWAGQEEGETNWGTSILLLRFSHLRDPFEGTGAETKVRDPFDGMREEADTNEIRVRIKPEIEERIDDLQQHQGCASLYEVVEKLLEKAIKEMDDAA